jgi:hypothetical protein
MVSRLHIWREILNPAWRWSVLIPVAALGAIATVRDELIQPEKPELFRLARYLPTWPWYVYALIGAAIVVVLILESAYRVVRKREIILQEIATTESTLTQLSRLHAEGRRRYNDTASPPQVYVRNLELWEEDVTRILQEKYFASELHFFRSYGSGATYKIYGASQEWLVATLDKRTLYTARIDALNHIVQDGGNHFLGPKMKLAEMMGAK